MNKNNYTSPDQQIIEGFEKTSVQDLLTTIAEYSKSNTDYRQLLEIFNNDYIPTFNKRKLASRNEIKLYIRRNFNTWYCSAINPYLTISPARFISSDIYNKFGVEAVVYPVCQPVFDKNKLADITYSFHCFTPDAHPFIDDLRLALKSMKSMNFKASYDTAFESIFSFIIAKFTDITRAMDFTFTERPYLITLYEVCKRLSFISLPVDYGTIEFNEDKIEAFFSISSKMKFERVVSVLIDNFIDSFANITSLTKKPVTANVMTVLKAENDFEDFAELLFGDMLQKLIGSMDTLVDADFDPYDFIDTLDDERSISILEAQSVISACCSNFFTIFGLYLQLIQPENNYPFIFSQSDDEFLKALKHEDENTLSPLDKSSIGAMFYYIPPGWYGLSAIGYKWFNLQHSLFDHEKCPFIPADESQDILRLMLLTAEDDVDTTVDNFLRKQLADPVKADNYINALSDLLNDEIFHTNGVSDLDLHVEDTITFDSTSVEQNKIVTGNCYICGVELNKVKMKNHVLKAHGSEKSGQDCFLIKIECAYSKDYWLFIDIPVDKQLSDIDAFLRKIWLECCGHLSGFRYPKRSVSTDIAMNRRLSTFSVGDQILHEYDYGSTTESLITIVGKCVRLPQKAAVRLLARNVAPEFQCVDCGKPARYICTECIYDSYNPFYCAKCGKKHIHDDMLLPVTNSPRLGVCGYDGELDTFSFDFKK